MAAALVKLHLLPARLLSGGAVLIKPRAETARGAGLFWGTSAKGGKTTTSSGRTLLYAASLTTF